MTDDSKCKDTCSVSWSSSRSVLNPVFISGTLTDERIQPKIKYVKMYSQSLQCWKISHKIFLSANYTLTDCVQIGFFVTS